MEMIWQEEVDVKAKKEYVCNIIMLLYILVLRYLEVQNNNFDQNNNFNNLNVLFKQIMNDKK